MLHDDMQDGVPYLGKCLLHMCYMGSKSSDRADQSNTSTLFRCCSTDQQYAVWHCCAVGSDQGCVDTEQ